MMTKTLKIKRTIKKIFAIVAAACAVATPTAVCAAPKSPCAFVKVTYSNSIKVQKGDVFHITYATEGAKKKKTLDVDAWKNKAVLTAVSVPSGTYVISAISYSGKSKDVKNAGYACAPSFTSSADKNKGTTIFIGIGDDAKNQIVSAYPSAIVVKGSASENTANADTPDSSDASDSASSQSTENVGNAEKASETKGEQSADPADSNKKDTADSKTASAGIDIKQKKNNKTNKGSKSEERFQKTVFSFFRRLAYLAIILIVGLVVLFKLHKDKYI